MNEQYKSTPNFRKGKRISTAANTFQRKRKHADNLLEEGTIPSEGEDWLSAMRKVPPKRNRIVKRATANEIPTIEEWKDKISTMKPEPQLIQDLFPDERGGYGVIAGRTGIGKTNLTLNLAYCLATGTPFLDLHCEKVGVAVLAFEGDVHNLMERVNKIGANYPDPGDLLHFDVMPIQNPINMLRDVGEKLRDTYGVKVAIIDPIKYLVPGNYLKPEEANTFIQAFREALTGLNMSAIITLPIKKPQDSKGLIHAADVYSIKGATDWVDSATFCFLLERLAYSKKSTEVTLSYAKHRISSRELDDENLHFDLERCMFTKDEFAEPKIQLPSSVKSKRATSRD